MKTFTVRLKDTREWREQRIEAEKVIDVEGEPLIFLAADGSVAGYFDRTVVESWYLED